MKKTMATAMALTRLLGTACGTTQGNSTGTSTSGSETRAGDGIVMRLAETQNDTYPATMNAIKFADLTKEKSGGNIDI